MRFSVYQQSHIGARKINQDRMGYSFTEDALLLLLADGMGGHLHGEVAADIAMHVISTLFQKYAQPDIKNVENFLKQAFYIAHTEIHRYQERHCLPETPRTTVVACLVQHHHAWWAHCGDSRLYWMRNGEILARTRDHSHIERMIAMGKIDASERANHPERNKLFNCLGAMHNPIVELSPRVDLQAGDVILLCSDGLWGTLPEQILVQYLQKHTVVRAVSELVHKAFEIAGNTSDNVTALAIAWGSDPYDLDSVMMSLPIIDTMNASAFVTAEADDIFSEADIEKAINEIRGAIQKNI